MGPDRARLRVLGMRLLLRMDERLLQSMEALATERMDRLHRTQRQFLDLANSPDRNLVYRLHRPCTT